MRLVALLLALLSLPLSHPEARLGAEGLGGVSTATTITGISCSPCSATTASASGVTVGNLTATVSGPSLLGPVFAIVPGADTSGLQISGHNLVIGTSAPAAATYFPIVSVQGTNTTPPNTPQQYTLTVVVSSVVTITGIATTPTSLVTTAGLATGTNVGTVNATFSGGAPPASATYACSGSCLSGAFAVSGTSIQIGASPPTASGTPYQVPVIVTAAATNSPDTVNVPVLVNAATISLVTPVTCSGCTATVGDGTGHSIGTLVPSSSGGSPGTITCNTTMPNNAGGRFQITSACGLQTGPTPYTAAGPYSVTVAFSGASASANPYNLAFSITVNSSGGVTDFQKRIVSNFGSTTTPGTGGTGAGFWLPLGQPFADGQIPAGDGVIWKTGGGETIDSQGDDCSHWPDGSVRFCSFTLLFPTALAPLAQDSGVGAFDNPGGGFNNSCFSGSPTTLITTKDIRLEATTSAATVTATLGATYKATGSGTNFTTTGVSGVIHPGDPITGTGVPSSTTIVSQTSGTTGGAGVYVTSNATTSSGATITETGHMDVSTVVSGNLGQRTGPVGTAHRSNADDHWRQRHRSWTVSPGAVYASGQVAAGIGTTWTLSANNEFSNEASTHTIMDRSGPYDCGYVITGQLRNGTTFASTPQGQLFGALYVDVRVDGTYRVEGDVFQCQPMASSTVQTTACNSVGLAPDANGDMYAIKDYSLTGAARQLMGCAFAVNPWVTPACITSGHATAGLGTVIYYGGEIRHRESRWFPV